MLWFGKLTLSWSAPMFYAAVRMHPDDARAPREELKMTVPQAAAHLSISAEAVRARIQRGTLKHTKEDGKVYVLLDHPGDDRMHRHDAVRTADQAGLVAELRDQVEFLRREVERKDAILLRMAEGLKKLAPSERGRRKRDE